jgi:hypothetical protein
VLLSDSAVVDPPGWTAARCSAGANAAFAATNSPRLEAGQEIEEGRCTENVAVTPLRVLAIIDRWRPVG